MNITADMLLKLSDAKLSRKQMAVVIDVLTELTTPLEKRREADRERKRLSRDTPRNVCGQSVESVADIPVKKERVPSPLLFPPAPPYTTPYPPKEKSLSGRAKRLASDWVLPEEDRFYANQKGLSDQTIADLVEEFVDWGKQSPKAIKLDWSATWRGFVRRKLKETSNGTGRYLQRPAKPAPLSGFAAAYAKLATDSSGGDNEAADLLFHPRT